MTTFETSQGFANIEGYRVNVTARHDAAYGYEPMKELVESTIKLWLFIAKKIAAGERTVNVPTTPEDKIADAIQSPVMKMPLAEPRVTIWGDMPSGSGFTVHSHSKAQDALDIYWSRYDALQTFKSAEPAPQVQNPVIPLETPKNTVLDLQSGVIPATRAPNPKEIVYANGQMVWFGVNKIAMGANKGSATYALWGNLGQKYPLMTVYKCKPNSDENSPNYIAIKDVVTGLGLSVDAGKVEAAGSWKLICKAVHVEQPDKSVKEYLNVVAIEAA